MIRGADAGAALRVVVVDDHAGFRRRAKAMLEDGGVEVVGEAVDGASCIEAVETLRPHAVILDVLMPGENGFRVAERIGALPEPPSVVLVSSRALADFGPRETASCVRGFLPKAELSVPALLALLTS